MGSSTQATSDPSTTAAEAVPPCAEDIFATDRLLIDARLAELVPEEGAAAQAARHSLLAPGKRLRAILTLAATRQCGGDALQALDAACAMELVHTASLVFDDLPAMDDAPLRRGRATPHTIYGEGVAILAGIGLLNGAFGLVSASQTLSAEVRTQIVTILSDAVGWQGLVGGQVHDLAALREGGATVEEIHHGKTGALFVASAVAGGLAGGRPQAKDALRAYGTALGLAYQALDDVLDAVADDALAGKPTGADGAKVTALSTARDGADALATAMDRVQTHLGDARNAVLDLGGATPEDNLLIALLASIEGHFTSIFARSGQSVPASA